jgi:hypothetical protein
VRAKSRNCGDGHAFLGESSRTDGDLSEVQCCESADSEVLQGLWVGARRPRGTDHVGGPSASGRKDDDRNVTGRCAAKFGYVACAWGSGKTVFGCRCAT